MHTNVHTHTVQTEQTHAAQTNIESVKTWDSHQRFTKNTCSISWRISSSLKTFRTSSLSMHCCLFMYFMAYIFSVSLFCTMHTCSREREGWGREKNMLGWASPYGIHWMVKPKKSYSPGDFRWWLSNVLLLQPAVLQCCSGCNTTYWLGNSDRPMFNCTNKSSQSTSTQTCGIDLLLLLLHLLLLSAVPCRGPHS